MPCCSESHWERQGNRLSSWTLAGTEIYTTFVLAQGDIHRLCPLALGSLESVEIHCNRELTYPTAALLWTLPDETPYLTVNFPRTIQHLLQLPLMGTAWALSPNEYLSLPNLVPRATASASLSLGLNLRHRGKPKQAQRCEPTISRGRKLCG